MGNLNVTLAQANEVFDGGTQHQTAHTALGITTKAVAGTANQITVNTVSGTSTLSTPQSIATTSDVTFNSIAGIHRNQVSNVPVATAGTPLGTTGTIDTQPGVGHGPNFATLTVTPGGTGITTGTQAVLTFPTAVSPVGIRGYVVFSAAGIPVFRGSLTRTSSTVLNVVSAANALVSGTQYTIDVFMYPY